MLNRFYTIAILAITLFPYAGNAEHFNVVYPRSSKDVAVDSRDVFPHKLLKLALKKSGDTVTLTPAKEVMESSRVNEEIENNRGITLAYTGMDAALEKRLRPIRIPIFRGLLGHRIFIIKKDRQADFAKIKTLDDLKTYTAGQGIGWQDVDILKAAGLPVVTNKYDLLFKLVDAGRIDYFPRGANEPFGELASRADAAKNLAVEKHVAIVYPFDLFFYTNKENEKLANAIERGLKKAYEDGSYIALFNADPGIRKTLDEANLKQRVLLHINNPLLSDEDKVIDPKYWMH